MLPVYLKNVSDLLTKGQHMRLQRELDQDRSRNWAGIGPDLDRNWAGDYPDFDKNSIYILKNLRSSERRFGEMVNLS